MKIERLSIVLHLNEKEKDALEYTRDWLGDLYEDMLDGESIDDGQFKVTDDDIGHAVDILSTILLSAVVD